MTLTAASRAALQKRKQLRKPRQGPPSEIQLQDARDATAKKLTELLGGSAKAKKIAAEIEEHLFTNSGGLNAEYRSTFRRIFTALKDPKSKFVDELLSGKLKGQDIVTKSTDELKTLSLQAHESELKEEAIRRSVVEQVLPENIQQLKDGRDREKWGVSRSAAAIDD